jgi:RHS repeat-associated protein
MKFGFQIPTPGAEGIYTKTKNYTDDGTVEIIKTPTQITIRTYIGGDAYGAPLYVEKTKTLATGAIVDKKYYLHRDYLGSIIAISDNTGTAVERRQFDAWGNLAKLQKNGIAIILPTNGTGAALMMLDRGYTSHEHLAEVGLIHMNGRLYDPVLRSFLMPDNFIQQPENTQNYNRYSYVLNNPLMYTDPSGEAYEFLAAVVIGAVVAATTYTLTALLADVPFSLGGLAKATFIGAASAAVTFGIGSAAGSLFGATTTISKAAFQAAAHGAFQGGTTAISGGKFWSNFAAGAVSSITSSAFSWDLNGTGLGIGWASSVRNNTLGMIAFSTVSGGAAAELTGGNFWQGAATAFVVSALNHAMHHIQLKSEIERKHPGLYKTLSKLKSYVKNNQEVLSAMSDTSGYDKSEVLKLLSLNNLVNIVKVGGTDGNNGFYDHKTPNYVRIKTDIVTSLDTGGYKNSVLQISETLNGTSFFAGVIVLHEIIHYGRYWNHLPQKIGIYEAGEVFETKAFGGVQGIINSTQNAVKHGW